MYNRATLVTMPNSTDWKADGFLNFWLPSKVPGKNAKLGSIPLKLSKPAEEALIKRLAADPEYAKVLLSKMIVDYRSATPSDTSGFALD
jgi:hypothetical protein